MERKALKYLVGWLGDADRKPLIIRGARQVGKTWLVRRFAELQKRQLVELNFEKRKQFAQLFVSNDPKEILLNLESALNLTITTRNSLLFLDEVQAASELLAKLRWFAEELPDLPVIAAGSLLEFVLEDHQFSMPVGRISYMHLEPLSFEEFLLAKSLNKLHDFIFAYQYKQEIPAVIHEQLVGHFAEYIVVGGMPAAVANWVEKSSLESLSRIHHDLLSTYRDDFSKYAERISVDLIDEVMMAVPRMLGTKFVYTQVNKNKKIATLKKSLSLLSKAKICYKVHHTSANGLPLGAEINEKYIKVAFLDVGLASTLLGLDLSQLKDIGDISLVNKGGVSEQVVAQLLRTIEPEYISPALYYWVRMEPSSSAEIDYVIQHKNNVVPIEVKSGSSGSLKSLHLFIGLKKLSSAVRVYSGHPSLTEVKVKTQQSASVDYQLLSVLFYLLGQLHRLLKGVSQDA